MIRTFLELVRYKSLAVLLVFPFVLIPCQSVMAQNCTIAIPDSELLDCPDCEDAEIVITNTTIGTDAWIKLYPQASDCSGICWDPNPDFFCLKVNANTSERFPLDTFFNACGFGGCPSTGDIDIEAIGLFCSNDTCTTCTSYCTPAECNDC